MHIYNYIYIHGGGWRGGKNKKKKNEQNKKKSNEIRKQDRKIHEGGDKTFTKVLALRVVAHPLWGSWPACPSHCHTVHRIPTTRHFTASVNYREKCETNRQTRVKLMCTTYCLITTFKQIFTISRFAIFFYSGCLVYSRSLTHKFSHIY